MKEQRCLRRIILLASINETFNFALHLIFFSSGGTTILIHEFIQLVIILMNLNH